MGGQPGGAAWLHQRFEGQAACQHEALPNKLDLQHDAQRRGPQQLHMAAQHAPEALGDRRRCCELGGDVQGLVAGQQHIRADQQLVPVRLYQRVERLSSSRQSGTSTVSAAGKHALRRSRLQPPEGGMKQAAR